MRRFLFLFLLIPSLLSAQQIATLDGSASTDPENGTLVYHWRIVSGPGQVTIANPDIKKTTVSIPFIAGDYVFELKVTDPGGLTSVDQVTIHVIPNPDIPPAVQAGSDQTVQLSATVTKFTLTGSATDVNGNNTITSYQWNMISGPNSPVVMTSNGAVTDVTNIVAGVYRFRLKVIDNGGASAADTVQVTVLAANGVPTSNAGPDITITLPVNSVAIGGADPGGLSVQWVKISGPQGGLLSDPTGSVTSVTGLSKGSYTYRKTTRNAAGLTASDDVNVTVKAGCFWLWKLLGWC